MAEAMGRLSGCRINLYFGIGLVREAKGGPGNGQDINGSLNWKMPNDFPSGWLKYNADGIIKNIKDIIVNTSGSPIEFK
jgi:hypothetical protein